MRKIEVLKVNPSTGTPGSIEVMGDFTSMFKGKFFRNAAGATLPWYTTPDPAGYQAILATTFDITENAKYAGRYTVYTQASAVDLPSSTFTAGKTTINVNEVIAPLEGTDDPALETDGYVTNISTFLLYTGTVEFAVSPGVNLTSYPIEFFGRSTPGWGEGHAQNFINLARNFAGAVAPTNPFVGQTWHDTGDGQLRSWNGSAWELVNQRSFGVTFKHTQGSALATWTVNHLLGLDAPFIAFVQFFDGDAKPLTPADVTFVTANQLTVTFAAPQVGYALVRP